MFKALGLLIVSVTALPAFALPLGTGAPVNSAPQIAPELRGSVDFSAIVALSNCSGSLVRFESSLGTDHGMILTNGHCLGGGFLKPGQVKVNEKVSRSFTLLTPSAQPLGTLNANKVLYATMTKTDLTLYGLNETYDEIQKKFGTTALTISAKHPVAGRKIAIASGYWKKIYSCSIDTFVTHLHEDAWIWDDSMRYLQPGCETIGGTSGSPVIDAETKEVVGVNNTGNDDGQKCTMDNPCEVAADGSITVIHHASYGQQTYWIPGCIDAKNEIDLSRAGCELPKP